MTIGERVLSIIKEKGMSQKEFSDKTGIPQSTISDWKKKNSNPTSDKLEIICEVLQIDPSFLISGNQDNKYKMVEAYKVYSGTEEYNLIEEYRFLDRDMRIRLSGYLDALMELQKKK